VKLYKGLACPLDGFEIVLFSLAGPDAKTYPLCPFCYNNPPQGAHKVRQTHEHLSAETWIVTFCSSAKRLDCKALWGEQ
jgi:hypothetical protein